MNRLELKKLFIHPQTAFWCRLILGGVFFFASWDKILHPEGFAQAVQNYRLLPAQAVNLIAVCLPWVELTSGLLLLFGLFTGGAAMVVALLLLTFLGAMGSALVRGLDIDCGCFSVSGAADRITILLFFRDLALLALTGPIILCPRQIISLDIWRTRTAPPSPSAGDR